MSSPPHAVTRPESWPSGCVRPWPTFAWRSSWGSSRSPSSEHPGRVHLGRLAVRSIARGTGLGARVVAALEQTALSHSGRSSVEMVLSAQERAMGFYERCGYRVLSGHRYLDAGIWHQDMARTVSSISAEGSARRTT